MDNAQLSIHAPLTGSDCIMEGDTMKQTTFQSTLPSRGAIMAGTKVIDITDISIHAPLTGSDPCVLDY